VTRAQLEAWALRIVDRVVAGKPAEDARVELKTAWASTDPPAAARQLGGHANASGGEPVLWVIGVDERRAKVIGADLAEIANWMPQVSSHFEGRTPALLDNIAFDHSGLALVALLFDTSRIPYTVKIPRLKGISADLEVPWRDGNRTRSATHEDLIRILVPLSRLPEFEVVAGDMFINRADDGPAPRLRLAADLYVYPQTSDRVIIPFRRCSCRVVIPDWFDVTIENVALHPQKQPVRRIGGDGFENRSTSLTIDSTTSEAIIDGPGLLLLRTEPKPILDPLAIPMPDEVTATIYVRPAGCEVIAIVPVAMRRIEREEQNLFQWRAGASTGWN